MPTSPIRLLSTLLALLALAVQLAGTALRPHDRAFGWCGPGSNLGLQTSPGDDSAGAPVPIIAALAEAGAVPLVPNGTTVGPTGSARLSDAVVEAGRRGEAVVPWIRPPPRGPPATT